MIEFGDFDNLYGMLRIQKTKEDKYMVGINYKISSEILKYRCKNNLNKLQLSKKIGVSQSMISKYESGYYNFTLRQIVHIVCALKLDSKYKTLTKSILGGITNDRIIKPSNNV